jgi:hypothetical protein
LDEVIGYEEDVRPIDPKELDTDIVTGFHLIRNGVQNTGRYLIYISKDYINVVREQSIEGG